MIKAYLTTLAGAAAITAAVAFATTSNTLANRSEQSNPMDATVIVKLEQGHGSGVHIGNGLILTAAHVVNGEDKITVSYQSGITRPATVLGLDKAHDVAVLETTYAGPSAKLSCSAVRVGEYLHIVGNPYDLEFIHTFGRVANAVVKQIKPWAEAVIGDIVAGPGNSGGPVFNSRNHVTGILVGGMSKPTGFGSSVSIPGWAFIVPASTICRLMGRT